MPDQTTTPAPLNLAGALVQAATGGFELKISGKLPGEEFGAALLNYMAVRQTNMAPQYRDRLDAVLAEQAEDLQYIWRKIWVTAGVLQPKQP